MSVVWLATLRACDGSDIGTFTGPAGTFRQRTELTKPQRDILKALQIEAPPRIYQLKLPASTCRDLPFCAIAGIRGGLAGATCCRGVPGRTSKH